MSALAPRPINVVCTSCGEHVHKCPECGESDFVPYEPAPADIVPYDELPEEVRVNILRESVRRARIERGLPSEDDDDASP